MIVYGGLSRLERAAAVAASVMATLREAEALPPGIGRHATLVRAFIRAAELVQGIADAAFERRGLDARAGLQHSGAILLLDMATAIDRSWRHGFAAGADIQAFRPKVEDLGEFGWIRTRTGEGYAHYAVYPESYLEVARRSGLGPTTCVIGLRSIGTGLAALVAAALEAGPAITLRPVGHPFDRQIQADADILDARTAHPNLHFAIVDEGPGLSGSSFASVAKWLFSLGVSAERVHFFPSHGGEPGDETTAETRSIWQRCRRHPACPEDVLFGPKGVRHWVESSVGSLQGGLEEVPVSASFPRDTRFERRKFLARTDKGTWLVKFAGLGDLGTRKLRDARAMACAGFGPETVGLCYGFLVQKYLTGEPLTANGHDRHRFLETLASYLAFRATGLGSPAAGASLEMLRHMAVENTAQSLGGGAAEKIDRRLHGLNLLSARVRPVRTDNRLHSWEWLALGKAFMKIDAVDHCEAHDLIGCQDIAWDVAGSIAEHDLTTAETASISEAARAAGAIVEPKMVAAMLPCYLAFQIGLWSTAHGPTAAAMADNYARKLAYCLDGPP